MCHRYRCEKGQSLWQAIDEAIAKHSPDEILEKLKQYFHHVHNCIDCGVVIVEKRHEKQPG